MRRRRWIVAGLVLLLAVPVAWWGVRAARDARLRRQLVGTWELVGAGRPDGQPQRLSFGPDGAMTGRRSGSVSTTWEVAGGTLILTDYRPDGSQSVDWFGVRETAPGLLEVRNLPRPPDTLVERVMSAIRPRGPLPHLTTLRRVE